MPDHGGFAVCHGRSLNGSPVHLPLPDGRLDSGEQSRTVFHLGKCWRRDQLGSPPRSKSPPTIGITSGISKKKTKEYQGDFRECALFDVRMIRME